MQKTSLLVLSMLLATANTIEFSHHRQHHGSGKTKDIAESDVDPWVYEKVAPNVEWEAYRGRPTEAPKVDKYWENQVPAKGKVPAELKGLNQNQGADADGCGSTDHKLSQVNPRFLVQKEPSAEETAVLGWVKAHPDYEGVVGNGRSKLVNDTLGTPPNEWSTLPYGPYPQKKFKWDDKVLGAKSGAQFANPTFGDQAGKYTGTLSQLYVPSAGIVLHQHHSIPACTSYECKEDSWVEGWDVPFSEGANDPMYRYRVHKPVSLSQYRGNPDSYIENNDKLAAKIKAEHTAAEKVRQDLVDAEEASNKWRNHTITYDFTK